jgi:hypothetical protein
VKRRFRFRAALTAILVLGCSYDRGDRWLEVDAAVVQACTVGSKRCLDGVLERCDSELGRAAWIAEQDCGLDDLVCTPSLGRCTQCKPSERSCDGARVMQCDERGEVASLVETCDIDLAESCRSGICSNLCTLAREERSNVGCEYWAVDLDNAVVDEARNAAAQQYAVVISNPQQDLPAKVTIEQDDTAPDADNAPVEIASATIPPFGLQKFLLGPREVDGSSPGTYNTGTHTALTRSAYRIKTNVPVVAYQFNPLDNVGVFSNDASLLKPVEALGSSSQVENHYVVLGWPQTIATTDDPETNFDPENPSADLRAFLTVVGTRPGTTVRVKSTTRIVGNAKIAEVPKDGMLEVTLSPFDVLNLETGGFNADFTGSLIDSDKPVVAFSGSEASDAPWFNRLRDRRCCADHLEEQLDPTRTAGKRFVAPISFNRSLALSRAGATLGVTEEAEFFRIIATTERGAHVTTTLPDHRRITLGGLGDFVELRSTQDFIVESDEPIMLGNVTPSQEAAGIPARLPGGDPSFLVIPPIEQYRRTYVFLTPDNYSFDFLRIVAPTDARMRLDDQLISKRGNCMTDDTEGLEQALQGDARKEFVVYRCQLTFPAIDPTADPEKALSPGDQSADGVHTLVSNKPVGVIVDGFDVNVSYGYAGGTELTEIVPR